MLRRTVLNGLAASAAVGLRAGGAMGADDVLKMGVSIPLTGAGFNAVAGSLPARSSFTSSSTAPMSPAERSSLSCATTPALPTTPAVSSRK